MVPPPRKSTVSTAEAPRPRPKPPVPILPLILIFVFAFLLEYTLPASFIHPLFSPSDPKRILILTAHPDDECMFFAPAILGLIAEGHELSGLCLSNGNADSLGHLREQELLDSYTHLGVPSSRVTVLDHPELQDGMTTEWQPEVIAHVLEEHLALSPVDIVITFDKDGVSQHPNHAALVSGFTKTNLLSTFSTKKSPTSSLQSPPRLFTLDTVPLWTKYTTFNRSLYHKSKYLLGKYYDQLFPLLGLESIRPSLPSLFASPSKETRTEFGADQVFLLDPKQYWKAVQAMMKHKTQMVWFRWLYIASSRYMWVAELREVEWCGSACAA